MPFAWTSPVASAAHDVVTFSAPAPVGAWRFGAGARGQGAAPRAPLTVNTAEAATDAAIAGVGLTRVLSHQIADAVRAGRLETALDDHAPDPVPVGLAHPRPGTPTGKLRALLDFAAPAGRLAGQEAATDRRAVRSRRVRSRRGPGGASTPQTRLTHTRSIVLATGTRRAGVRRKLDATRGRGWIERDGAGASRPTARAQRRDARDDRLHPCGDLRRVGGRAGVVGARVRATAPMAARPAVRSCGRVGRIAQNGRLAPDFAGGAG